MRDIYRHTDTIASITMKHPYNLSKERFRELLSETLKREVTPLEVDIIFRSGSD